MTAHTTSILRSSGIIYQVSAIEFNSIPLASCSAYSSILIESVLDLQFHFSEPLFHLWIHMFHSAQNYVPETNTISVGGAGVFISDETKDIFNGA